jgi:hypothetical protein
MAEEQIGVAGQPADVPTHQVRETQTRTVRGGHIVILQTRTVRSDDGATIGVVAEDVVAKDVTEVIGILSAFLA